MLLMHGLNNANTVNVKLLLDLLSDMHHGIVKTIEFAPTHDSEQGWSQLMGFRINLTITSQNITHRTIEYMGQNIKPLQRPL